MVRRKVVSYANIKQRAGYFQGTSLILTARKKLIDPSNVMSTVGNLIKHNKG